MSQYLSTLGLLQCNRANCKYMYMKKVNIYLRSILYLRFVVLITILPKNQAAPIEMVISDFFRIPKTFIAFVSLCHKSPKAKGKL